MLYKMNNIQPDFINFLLLASHNDYSGRKKKKLKKNIFCSCCILFSINFLKRNTIKFMLIFNGFGQILSLNRLKIATYGTLHECSYGNDSPNKIIACRRQLSVRYSSRLLLIENLLGNATRFFLFFDDNDEKITTQKADGVVYIIDQSCISFTFVFLSYCLRAFASFLLCTLRGEKITKNELFAFFVSIFLSEHQWQFSLSLHSLTLF